MLTCKNITITRGYNTLFTNVSFSLFQGCCLNIVGKNGIGKTSFLNYISTLADTKKETVFVNDIDVLKALDEYRQISHYLGHKNPIYSELTVEENLNFWGKIYDNTIAIPAALECFGLQKFTDYKAKTLSQGWQRKLALSLLLIKNSKIWLIDEPFANLDEEGQDYFLDLMKIRCDQKGIVIFTSHRPISSGKICHLYLDDFKN